MAKKKTNTQNMKGLHSEVTAQPITETLEANYMPYAMSTNVSRAFPEIDGFKPSHRKLLYTIYETMVRLATGNEALLAPFVESKGNFGKYYSGDLTYAASRYTVLLAAADLDRTQHVPSDSPRHEVGTYALEIFIAMAFLILP